MTDQRSVVDYLGADPLETALRLEGLAADLRWLSTGRGPTEGELVTAPVLKRWGLISRASVGLIGTVYDHPLLGSGRHAVTSELFAIDSRGAWARTLSRYYRLTTEDMQ